MLNWSGAGTEGFLKARQTLCHLSCIPASPQCPSFKTLYACYVRQAFDHRANTQALKALNPLFLFFFFKDLKKLFFIIDFID